MVVIAIGAAVGATSTGVIIGAGLAAVISLGYFPYFWTRGQTPGMRVAHLRVVLEAGPPELSMGTSIRRYIVFVFGAAALFIGWAWVFIDARRKAWHDIAARTIVVHEAPRGLSTDAATSQTAAGATSPAPADGAPSTMSSAAGRAAAPIVWAP